MGKDKKIVIIAGPNGAARVKQEGHNIPENVIRRRFDSGLKNFYNIYRTLVNSWVLYNNAGIIPHLIASGDNP
jgi:predicted ABC-type ATPase